MKDPDMGSRCTSMCHVYSFMHTSNANFDRLHVPPACTQFNFCFWGASHSFQACVWAYFAALYECFYHSMAKGMQTAGVSCSYLNVQLTFQQGLSDLTVLLVLPSTIKERFISCAIGLLENCLQEVVVITSDPTRNFCCLQVTHAVCARNNAPPCCSEQKSGALHRCQLLCSPSS